MTLSSSMLLEIETKRRLLLLSALFIHGFKSIVIIEKSFSRMLLLLLFLLVLDLRVKWRARARLAS
jgi:hypothetical protein